MIRVVNEGSLATRNGRIITKKYQETYGFNTKKGSFFKHICFNEDMEYDFGGHIWAGRISWLRKAWNHIPFSLENSEDFWISATLKSFYNYIYKNIYNKKINYCQESELSHIESFKVKSLSLMIYFLYIFLT